MVLWCNWLALRTLNPAIRVQVPVGPLFFLFPWDRTQRRNRIRRHEGDTLAEWLRRVIRNHMGYSRAGSNPAGVADFCVLFIASTSGLGVMMYGSQPCDPGSSPGGRNQSVSLLGRVV